MEYPTKKVGACASLLLSIVFCVPVLAVTLADLTLNSIRPGEPLVLTLRIPGIGIYRDTIHSGRTFRHDRIVIPRGQVIPPGALPLIQAHEELRRPPGPALAIGLALLAAGLLFLLSRISCLEQRRTCSLRAQATLLGFVAAAVVCAKLYLILTPFSSLWIPLSLIVIPVSYHLGHRAAIATAISGALLMGIVSPFDTQLSLTLLGQGLTAASFANHPRHHLSAFGCGVVAAIGGGTSCVGTSLVLAHQLPDLGTQLLPVASAGLAGGILSWLVSPMLGRMLGTVSRSRLARLADLDAPLLKQLAAKAPGTWGHSMAMANMAEMAANAIGADALLVRVGAYYHDLGKALQPRYFIENQDGENPHDKLAPDVSADAIFSHVTDGAKQARKHKLPREIVEFIETHHGRSVLEYFWHKNKALGQPKPFNMADFRYPGQLPQTRETAILSLCDAVEAASRTLDDPSNEEIHKLVRRITLSKLEHGMLAESGLTLVELQRVMDSLAETLRSSHHGRIRYPWQDDGADENGPTLDGATAHGSDQPIPHERSPQDPAGTIAGDRADNPTADLVDTEEPVPTDVQRLNEAASTAKAVAMTTNQVNASEPSALPDTAARQQRVTQPLGGNARSDEPDSSKPS